MKYVVNTLYSILTWLSAFVIGFDGTWSPLAWTLVVMAAVQTFSTIYEAITECK